MSITRFIFPLFVLSSIVMFRMYNTCIVLNEKTYILLGEFEDNEETSDEEQEEIKKLIDDDNIDFFKFNMNKFIKFHKKSISLIDFSKRYVSPSLDCQYSPPETV